MFSKEHHKKVFKGWTFKGFQNYPIRVINGSIYAKLEDIEQKFAGEKFIRIKVTIEEI